MCVGFSTIYTFAATQKCLSFNENDYYLDSAAKIVYNWKSSTTANSDWYIVIKWPHLHYMFFSEERGGGGPANQFSWNQRN